jgi:hypothetical protein
MQRIDEFYLLGCLYEKMKSLIPVLSNQRLVSAERNNKAYVGLSFGLILLIILALSTVNSAERIDSSDSYYDQGILDLNQGYDEKIDHSDAGSANIRSIRPERSLRSANDFGNSSTLDENAVRPDAACKPQPCSSEYAVILSPGPTPDIRWGGYHVTITGFDNSNNMKGKVRDAWLAANQNKPDYNFTDKTYSDKPTNNPKKYWTCSMGSSACGSICFNSNTLDKFADNLHKAGFENIKGQKYANQPWHISLYRKNETDARDKFETTHLNNFKKSLKNLPWHVYVAKKPGKTCSHDNETPPPSKCLESGCCDKSCWTEIIFSG